VKQEKPVMLIWHHINAGFIYVDTLKGKPAIDSFYMDGVEYFSRSIKTYNHKEY
jgi:hypothetical protein